MSHAGSMPLVSNTARPLAGRCRVPGDKSISHRALILGALAVGRTRVTGLLEGDDVLRTAQALCALGARIERGEDGVWTVKGVGVGGLSEPDDMLDLGNSGTGARLLMGAVASHPFTSFFTGDASLRRRPMGAGRQALGRDRRPLHRARRRPTAACRHRRREPAADHLSPARPVRPGQVRGAARRAQRAGRDGGRGAAGDARSQRAAVAPLRRERAGRDR